MSEQFWEEKRTSICGHWCPHYIKNKTKQKLGIPPFSDAPAWVVEVMILHHDSYQNLIGIYTVMCWPHGIANLNSNRRVPHHRYVFRHQFTPVLPKRSPRAGNSCSTLKNYLNPINLKLFANGGLALLDDVSFSIFATSCCAEKIGKVWRRSRESQSGVACVSCIALSKVKYPKIIISDRVVYHHVAWTGDPRWNMMISFLARRTVGWGPRDGGFHWVSTNWLLPLRNWRDGAELNRYISWQFTRPLG